MTLQFGRRLLDVMPPWLKEGQGYPYLLGIGALFDRMNDGFTFVIDAAHPGLVTNETLDIIGRDRLIVRGLTESDESYSKRLWTWRQSHRKRGTSNALLGEIKAFLDPNFVRIELISRVGTKWAMDASGNITRAYTTEAESWYPVDQCAHYRLVFYNDAPLPTSTIDALKAITFVWHAEHMIGDVWVLNGDRLWDDPRAWDGSRSWDSIGTASNWTVR